MPLRTKLFQLTQWSGGLNTSLDPAMIPNSDLVVLRNVIQDTKWSKRKRGGIQFWDYDALTTHRSSSGTTRSLVFSSSVAGIFSPGDEFSVNHSQYNSAYDNVRATVVSITTTNVANDTITYTQSPSLTEGSTAATIKVGLYLDSSSIGAFDFWYNGGSGSKLRENISVLEDGTFYTHNSSGLRTELVNAGTALSSPSQCNFLSINERLIMAFDESANTPKVYYPNSDPDVQDLGGTPPNFSLCNLHLGRVWTNDKLRPDRLHYSTTANPEEWNGVGDSGAIDIGIGDGDPVGITAIFPTFKGELFVAKQTKLYRVSGFNPEDFRVELVSNGIGCISQDSVAQVDNDDVIFASARGFHSLGATANFGDFSASFISLPIQSLFNEFGNLENISARYVPELNSIAFGVSNGGVVNDGVLLYNVVFKTWYEWPELSSQALMLRTEGSRKRLYLGTNEGRILQTQTALYSDYGYVGIAMGAKTGIIYPDGQLYTVKGFKRLVILYRPKGGFSFTAKVKIDNYEEQPLVFSQEGEGDALGVDFVLGESILGIDPVLSPYSLPIDGYGRGFTLEITQTGSGQDVEIYGFGVEYEDAGTSQEVILGGGGNL